MLHPSIAIQLTSDDDPELWDLALTTILGDAAYACRESREEVYAQIGSCRQKVVHLYGFRKKYGTWRLAAASNQLETIG